MTTFSRVSLVSDRAVVVAVVFAAMLRVLFFVGLFPLFNNVDEVAHIDLVIKRETGLPTGADEPYAMATRDLIFRFGYGAGLAHDGREIRLYLSPQFVDPIPESGDAPIPVWLAPDSVQKAVEPVAQAVWSTRRNHEATELPLYYAIAARWARLGERLGFRLPDLFRILGTTDPWAKREVASSLDASTRSPLWRLIHPVRTLSALATRLGRRQ